MGWEGGVVVVMAMAMTAMSAVGDMDGMMIRTPGVTNGVDLTSMTPAAATTQAEARQQRMMRGPVNVVVIFL